MNWVAQFNGKSEAKGGYWDREKANKCCVYCIEGHVSRGEGYEGNGHKGRSGSADQDIGRFEMRLSIKDDSHDERTNDTADDEAASKEGIILPCVIERLGQ